MSSDIEHAHDTHCHHPKIADVAAARLLVGDVMVTRPKTLPATATVADVRRMFANPHVVSALLADGPLFAGILNRDTLPAGAPDDASARDYARTDVPTARPEMAVSEAVGVLDSNGERRLVVLAADGVTLAGLVCLDETRDGFCQSNSPA